MNTVSWPAVAAAWGVLLGGAAGVMKVTDAVHSWAETHLGKIAFPPYTWIVVACGVGVVTCLTSHLNPLVTLYPPLAHTYGEVLSGIALGGIASPGHHFTALIAAKANAVSNAGVPPGDAGQSVVDFTMGPDAEPSPGTDQTPPSASSGGVGGATA